MSKPALTTSQCDLLSKAAECCAASDLDPYFELRRLLASVHNEDRLEFKRRFTTYYRLNHGGLTEAFKARFFELLFAFKLASGSRDPYEPLLRELYEFPRRKGDRALQASFVSKLVAVHDDSRPIYDVHVHNFFGISPPAVGPIEFRIAGLVANLRHIQDTYEAWTADARFTGLVQPLMQQNASLRTCHPTRLCDLLVWTVGARKVN
jgi:hypothetical protein